MQGAEVGKILIENEKRNAHDLFEPVSGEGSILKREKVVIDDYYLPEQYLPVAMLEHELVAAIVERGSIEAYVADNFSRNDREGAVESIRRIMLKARCKYDFAFWCASYIKIESKEGGGEVPFILNNPQRKLATFFEEQRLADKPLRTIILKARQWGGSTCTQIYMAWLQMVHNVGLNSLIIAHVLDTATNIKAMFARLLRNYPVDMLYDLGETPENVVLKFEAVGSSRNVHSIPTRDCKVQIGSAERPDSCRGENHTLLHCSEVASWKRTEGRDPADIVRSASAGILYRPMTMITYESTAERTGDFFHGEWKGAVDGTSQFRPLFVPWYQIEQYRLSIEDSIAFAQRLWEGRESDKTESDREDSGRYLWYLWENGATLEHIAWYIEERKKFTSHEKMAREYPTDDVEAFAHTQATVFSALHINKFRASCKPPMAIGELHGDALDGDECLDNLSFIPDKLGQLYVWEEPEEDVGNTIIADRYLTVVDVGRGISNDADYSDILVLDRLMMMDGGRAVVVAEWHGHIDIDLLAWKSAQVAKWYNNSLLVIESNTIESNGGVGANFGDSAAYVLELIAEVYPNMYFREASEENAIKKPTRKIGFHTNRKTKRKVIEELKRMIRERGYVERNEAALVEYEVYEQADNGAYFAPHGQHDDRLMTRAIGLYVSNLKMDLPRLVEKRQPRETHRQTLNEAML